jgi:hypothetical protein
MKMIRPVVYSFIGAVVGLIAGFFLIGTFFSDATGENIILAVPLVCAVVLGSALYLLGKKLTDMQDHSEKTHGYFALVNTLGAFLLVIPFVTSLGISILVPGLASGPVVSLAISIGGTVLAAWLGARYAAKKGILISSHDPMKTALWVTGLFAALYAILSYLIAPSGPFALGAVPVISVIVNLVATGISVYFFVKTALPRNTVPTTVGSF